MGSYYLMDIEGVFLFVCLFYFIFFWIQSFSLGRWKSSGDGR